jgi:hypothetical protein
MSTAFCEPILPQAILHPITSCTAVRSHKNRQRAYLIGYRATYGRGWKRAACWECAEGWCREHRELLLPPYDGPFLTATGEFRTWGEFVQNGRWPPFIERVRALSRGVEYVGGLRVAIADEQLRRDYAHVAFLRGVDAGYWSLDLEPYRSVLEWKTLDSRRQPPVLRRLFTQAITEEIERGKEQPAAIEAGE